METRVARRRLGPALGAGLGVLALLASACAPAAQATVVESAVAATASQATAVSYAAPALSYAPAASAAGTASALAVNTASPEDVAQLAIRPTDQATPIVAIALGDAIAVDGPGATVDGSTLASDNSRRDGFVKQSTLQTGQFPTATFVPTAGEGLPTPLPTSGAVSFALVGDLTVHGVTWPVSGALKDGQVVIAAGDAEVQLILDGVDLASSTNAPVYVESGETTIVLADGSENRLADGATRPAAPEGTEEANAALYSAVDLTIGGDGELTVEGRYNDGIASRGDLDVVGGTITVTARADGIRGRDRLVIDGGIITVEADGGGRRRRPEVHER
jgi:hypothetical protein